MNRILAGVIVWELAVQAREFSERRRWWDWSRRYCDAAGKSLLRVGMKRSFLEPPNGDVTLDMDPAVSRIPGGVLGDERAMPFRNREFGVAFNEHTLEHLGDRADVEAAVNECIRVADVAVLLAPSPYSIIGTFLTPTHDLRLWLGAGVVKVAPNVWRTGLGAHYGVHGKAALNQVMLATGTHPVRVKEA